MNVYEDLLDGNMKEQINPQLVESIEGSLESEEDEREMLLER